MILALDIKLVQGGLEMKKHRQDQLVKHRKRKEKLRKLRAKYSLAGSDEEKKKIMEKVRKIAPWLSPEEFLKPLEESKR